MSKIAVLLCSYGVVRSAVRFAERNHLTARTREDIFYHTNPTFECLEQDSVLSCFTSRRTAVRPTFCFRRWYFDWQRVGEPELIRLESNLEVRKTFRNIREDDVLYAISIMQVAPTNNHGKNAATRNAASHLLSHMDWGKPKASFKKFSLSGSLLELLACGYGYRGRHQATDLAFERRRDVVLEPAKELLEVPSNSWVIISTDTTNHLPQADKDAILGNGIPIVSYSPTAITETTKNPDRTTYWDGNVLVTGVNGGGTYHDRIGNGALDVEFVDCPDGALMLVYVDVFRDPVDRTHAYISEVPFARVARGTALFEKFRNEQRATPISPYTVKNKNGQTFSCLSVRHNNLIQVVDNDARQTHYFTRPELLALAGTEPGMRAKFRLQDDSPVMFGEKQNDALRYECLLRLGFSNLHLLCKNCPEINIPRPTRQGRLAWVAETVIEAAEKGDDFRAIIARNPDDQDFVESLLRRMHIKYRLPPSPDEDKETTASTTDTPPPGFDGVAMQAAAHIYGNVNFNLASSM